MPYYKITVKLKRKREIVGLRQFDQTDIEQLWHKLRLMCQNKYAADMEDFDCVMISKRSQSYRDLTHRKSKEYDDIYDIKIPEKFKAVEKRSSSGLGTPLGERKK